MRIVLALLATTALAACGGGGTGPTAVGGGAAPNGPPTGGTPTASNHSFVNPTEARTYEAIGGAQHFAYATDGTSPFQYEQLYAGDATTVRNSGISVAYNPRDAIFNVVISQPDAIVNRNERYQDPLHRTAFGGQAQPQAGVPDLTSRDYRFLEAGTSSTDANGLDTYDHYTFFYQQPGTTTNYVTLAGYVRNNFTESLLSSGAVKVNYILERGVMVFGERTVQSAIPRTGTGTFNGEMLASMVFNPLYDNDVTSPTYFQWISGTSTTRVDFAGNSFSLDLAGTVSRPMFDANTTGVHAVPQNSTFTAAGSGRIDLAGAGGLVGRMNSAFFLTPTGTRYDVNIVGTSIDAAFFGPQAQEVGGGFRIVGGTPDQRVDIHGVFTGRRP